MSTIDADRTHDGRVTRRPDDPRPDPATVGTRLGACEADPVTGPMPVLRVAGGHVAVSERRGVTIVAIDGGLDTDLAAAIAAEVAAAVVAVAAVIVDLDQVALLEQAGLDALIRTVQTAAPEMPCCVVASRLSGRLVLDRWGIAERLAVFTSVADALQSREFDASGYGVGWSTPRP